MQQGYVPPAMPNLHHDITTDPESACQQMKPWMPLRNLQSQVPGHNFYLLTSFLDLGKAQLISISASNVRFQCDVPTVHLIANSSGTERITMPAGELQISPGGMALLPPGEREVEHFHSAVVIQLQPEQVARVAAIMAGRNDHADASPQAFSGFKPLGIPSGPSARLLHGQLQSINASTALDPQLAIQLGYDDILIRLIATLLNPALLHQDATDQLRWQERDGRAAFDELIDYIRANLDQPLRLSDLEARSHYSSRALQYAFRKRLGCSPKQWIREQRLEHAMQQVQQSPPKASIKAIALACGYRHMGLFSRDFRNRYGLTPSQVSHSQG